jgi:hypothetical protein
VSRAGRAGWLLAASLVATTAAARPAKKQPKHSKSDPCALAPDSEGPGTPDPFKPPATRAAELNAAAKVPYRQGKWDEARSQYREALALDPAFLAPKLNVACSFVRQERFAEATAEVVGLLDRAYVPWAREILDAADLGALKARPEMKEIQRAMAASAARWGEGLDDAFLYVARQRAPLRVPDGPGVFLLNPSQEVWAYLPRTQRYRQLTAEDGHVVALARSTDGQRIAYVTAEKLVRGAREDDVSLRGVTLHQLALATMTVERSARIEGDIERLEIVPRGGSFWFRTGDTNKQWRLRELAAAGGATDVVGAPRTLGRPAVVLTGKGADAIREQRFGRSCVLTARQEVDSSGQTILRLLKGKATVATVATGNGAGLGGLALP